MYSSGLKELDDFLQGGLPSGCLCEWGVPFGQGGRELVLSYISMATHQRAWCLWSSSDDEVEVYPPAWAAKGVDLEYVRFVQTNDVIKDLRPVFFDPFFKVIVLDAPKKLSKEDIAFLAKQARKNNQLIILLRNFYLKPSKGNVFARFRFNCKRRVDGGLSFVSLKGAQPKGLNIRIPDYLDSRLLTEIQ